MFPNKYGTIMSTKSRSKPSGWSSTRRNSSCHSSVRVWKAERNKLLERSRWRVSRNCVSHSSLPKHRLTVLEPIDGKPDHAHCSETAAAFGNDCHKPCVDLL